MADDKKPEACAVEKKEDDEFDDMMVQLIDGVTEAIVKEKMRDLLAAVRQCRKAISEKILGDESQNLKDTFEVERIPDAYKAAWEAWKKNYIQKEDYAYQAFKDTMLIKSPE